MSSGVGDVRRGVGLGGYEEIPDNYSASPPSVLVDVEGASSDCGESDGGETTSLSSGLYDSVPATRRREDSECDGDDGADADKSGCPGRKPSSYQSSGPKPPQRWRRGRRGLRPAGGGEREEGRAPTTAATLGRRIVPALLLGATAAAAALYRCRRVSGTGVPVTVTVPVPAHGGAEKTDAGRPALSLEVLDGVRSQSSASSSSLSPAGDVPLEGFSFSQILPGAGGGLGGPEYTLAGFGGGGASSFPSSGGGSPFGSSGGSRTFKCEYTGMARGRTVRMIQTSKKDPDRQWVNMDCLRNDHAVFAQDDAMDGAAVLSLELPAAERRQYQEIIGFGGSITEATALNWKRLSGAGQNLVLELLYGRSGLGYTLGRIPIGSCDFSVANYDFHDSDGDFDLRQFDDSVQHDVNNGMVEMMNRAASWVRNNWHMGTELRLVASPWSPPAWMKRPVPGSDPKGSSHASGIDRTALPECLRDGTGPDSRYARSWALYLSAFLDAYRKRGIDVWAITAQNEPGSSPAYEACSHSMSSERDFLAYHLGPVMRERHPNVKILVYDYNKDDCAEWMNYMWNEEGAAAKSKSKSTSSSSAADVTQYIDGVALHWYSRTADHELDGGEGMPNMHLLKQLASDREWRQQQQEQDGISVFDASPDPPILLDTEASHCSSTGYAINDQEVSWYRAERYAHAILSQLAAGSNGWIDWNMILDPFGGPNHVENFCDAPIIAVPHRAVNAFDIQPIPSFEKHQLEEGEAVLGEYETKYSLNKKMGYPMAYMDAGIVVQPVFFYLGHVTRHVRPGSRPLRALVDQSRGGTVARTFRRRGQTEPGGGRNRNARVGTEVTLWPCEGSTRQSWFFTEKGQLRVRERVAEQGGGGGDGDNGNGNGNGNGGQGEGCVALADASDPSLGGILLTGCDSRDAAIFQLAPTGASYESMQVVKFVAQRKVNKCLGILPLANEGGAYGRRGGAQAVMVPCDHPSSLWEYFPQTGEVLSYFFSPPNENGTVCLTTGWPFLQAGAFDTTSAATDTSSVVVVLNESDDEANFVVTLSNGAEPPPVLKSSIPAHSIQTYLL